MLKYEVEKGEVSPGGFLDRFKGEFPLDFCVKKKKIYRYIYI